MGLDKNGIRFLFYCKTLAVDFSQTAMIGRQDLHLRIGDLKSVFRSFGMPLDNDNVAAIFNQNQGYAEPLLSFLGARDVQSFDKSSYEGATHLHDMNHPMPEQFAQQYSTVLDGGSLEHVFNFPVAIKNGMDMVRVGGHYLAITPANNFLGHGFYQFSPELFFSIFTPGNGFELRTMVAVEDRPNARWYKVKSPREINGRVTLTNSVPVYLLVVARKLAHVRVFSEPPQQSDYVPQWEASNTTTPGSRGTAFLDPIRRYIPQIIRRFIPSPVKRLIAIKIRQCQTGFSPRFFSPMDPTASIGPLTKPLLQRP